MSKVDGGGLRYNKDKLPMHLVPTSCPISFAEVMKVAMKKYPERNWERGMKYSIPYACALRHLFSWWSGEDLDQETGLNHLKHVLCNIAFLIEYLDTFPEGDDRPGSKNEESK